MSLLLLLLSLAAPPIVTECDDYGCHEASSARQFYLFLSLRLLMESPPADVNQPHPTPRIVRA